MDCDMYDDIQQILCAQQYLDLSKDANKLLYEWAELQRQAIDIYDLVYSPWFQEYSQDYRKNNDITLDDIIMDCEAQLGRRFNPDRIPEVSSIPEDFMSAQYMEEFRQRVMRNERINDTIGVKPSSQTPIMQRIDSLSKRR